jgi:hypothetical protein
MEPDAGRRHEVAVWASHLAFEDCVVGKSQFVVHHMFDALVERLKMGVPGLVFVTGVQGVGKTCILILACCRLRELGYETNFLNLGDARGRLVFEGLVQTGVPGGIVFVDLPDYPRSGARALNRDLDLVGRVYFSQWGKCRSTFVVSVQKELFRGHFLLGKEVRLEVPRIPPAELMGVYREVFGDYEPFTEDSLRVVAEASRGVLRRFHRYIGLCLGGTRGLVGVEDVRRVLTVDVAMEDLGLELASFLRGMIPAGQWSCWSSSGLGGQ